MLVLYISSYQFEVIKDGRVIIGEKGDGHTSLPGSACSADAVSVAVDGLGHVIVEYQ